MHLAWHHARAQQLTRRLPSIGLERILLPVDFLRCRFLLRQALNDTVKKVFEILEHPFLLYLENRGPPRFYLFPPVPKLMTGTSFGFGALHSGIWRGSLSSAIRTPPSVLPMKTFDLCGSMAASFTVGWNSVSI